MAAHFLQQPKQPPVRDDAGKGNDKDMGGVPKRATYVIDRAGVIQYVDCNEDARIVPDFSKVKTKLSELK